MTTVDSKPKHKPSEKLTLEEVLKSLQDMIRTDLLGDDFSVRPVADQLSTMVPTETPPLEPKAVAHEDFAPVSPSSGPVNLGAVVRSLEDLVTHQLNASDEPAQSLSERRHEDEVISASPTPFAEELTPHQESEITSPPTSVSTLSELPPEIAPEPFGEPEPSSPPTSPEPEGALTIALGIQQELLLETAPTIETEKILDERSDEVSVPPTPPSAEIEVETTSNLNREQISMIETPLPAIDEATETAQAFATDVTPEQTPAPSPFNDIPILQDVITPPTGATPLPRLAPERTRDLVIRAIAKLNIELRKSGDPGLNPKIIHRLQQLVCEELEKAVKEE